MMHERLQAVVGTALVDSKFRQGLLRKSPDILSGFGLSPEESQIVLTIKADTLQGFAREITANSSAAT